MFTKEDKQINRVLIKHLKKLKYKHPSLYVRRYQGNLNLNEKFNDRLNGLRQANLVLITYASSEGSAKVQASLRIHTVSPELPLLAHTSRESSREAFETVTQF